jgi:RNA polymerase sigma-70 factor (ECF subfamily)
METTIDHNQLVLAAQNGDKQAFAKLYDIFAKRIYQYFAYRLNNRDIAEDLTSQTFIKSLEKIANYNTRKGNFSSWIYTIARNTLIDHVRADHHIHDLEEIWNLSSPTNLNTEIEHRIEREKILQILSKLPTNTKDIVMMRVWDELSYQEIATLTGKSESACKMTFSRALTTLKNNLPLPLLIFFLSQTYEKST